MARAVVLLFLIVAVATISAYPQGFQKECGQNEVFTTCGSTCTSTCENPSPRACTLACKIGCECKPGYLRNAQNNCVLTQHC
ncbi:chymotrypsin inhibitor-like [Odontomachus brunneus]|uniref:chymotrypsin inhibitor-like n=1 Tax=Odontomachus brunneus TaxID=486640 RepID=UPI0013F1E9CF|nr:chymotrypsin inhibitor-like [Odontomachus brunneus]